MEKEALLIGFVILILSIFFDSEILNWISLIKNNFLNILMAIITSAAFLIIVYLFYAYLLKKPNKILLLGLIGIVTYLLGFVLKLMVMRERPDIADFVLSDYSFPSNHAMLLFSPLAMMNHEFPNLKWMFLIIALLVIFSRIYFGVHYLSDVIGGGLIGYGIGWAMFNKIRLKEVLGWKISGKRN